MTNKDYYEVVVQVTLPVRRIYKVAREEAATPMQAEAIARTASLKDDGAWYQDGTPLSQVYANCVKTED